MNLKSKGALLLVFGATVIGWPMKEYFDREEFVIGVTGKERINDRDNPHYRVYTDQGTFRNTDAALFGKFNSGDLQGRLKEDEFFKVKANGWRVPWLSMFRNIISAEPLKEVPTDIGIIYYDDEKDEYLMETDRGTFAVARADLEEALNNPQPVPETPAPVAKP